MRRCIKTELWKATHNIYFILSMGISVTLVFCNIMETNKTVSELTERSIELQKLGLPIYQFTGCSLFIWWIAHNGVNFGSVFFYMIWPILVAMPYAWSFAQESCTGAMVQYCSRSSRKQYYFAKYLAVFISGGLVMAFPIWLDLMLNALICPSESLQFMNALTTIENRSFLSSLFYSHPWIHALIWCGVELLWGGSVATLSFLLGRKLRLSVTAVIFPFALLYVLTIIGEILKRTSNTMLVLNPMQLAMQAPLGTNPGWLVFSCIFAFAILSLISGCRVIKHDLL